MSNNFTESVFQTPYTLLVPRQGGTGAAQKNAARGGSHRGARAASPSKAPVCSTAPRGASVPTGACAHATAHGRPSGAPSGPRTAW